MEWISSLEDDCRQVSVEYIYMIFDQAAVDFSIIPILNGFPIEWHSLWQGLPEESSVRQAPLLIRFELNNRSQRLWLDDLCGEVATKSAVLMFCSLWPTPTLAGWLQKCTDGRHEGRPGLLRFYDPRLFPLLSGGLLNDEQRQQLHRPVLFWSWLDRDGAPQRLVGDGSPPVCGEDVKSIDLSDQQLEYLMCVCDANILLAQQPLAIPSWISAESLFQICYRGMQEATDKGLIMDDERDAWVCGKISEYITDKLSC